MTEPVRTCAEHGPFSAERDRCPACGSRGERLLSGPKRRRLSKFMSGALRHFPDDVGLELDDRGWTDYDALVAAVERKYDWADADHVAAVVATDPKGRFERTDGGSEWIDGERDDADSGRVRAAYGHSVAVDLESEARSARESLCDSRSPSEVRSTSEGASDSGVARDSESSSNHASGPEAREQTGSEATRETEPTDAPVPDELYHGTAPANVDSILEEGLRPMGRQQVHLSGSRDAARRVGRRHVDDPVLIVVDAAGMLADGRRIAKRGRETYTTDTVPPAFLSVDGE